MAYVSLYRKWRPQSFSQIVGQDHVSRTLSNAIEADHVGHAYLFAGPRGTGKTSSAKILAKSVNCLKGPTPEPCGTCESCKTIMNGTSLDVIEMDAASNRGIDEIRELRDKVAFAATIGRKKVYIVDEVHMLTEHAFNALLKTLEEPPSHVIFILATTDAHKVPVTISSRCQHFVFRPISMQAMAEHVIKVAKSEKVSIAKEAALVIARQAEGSLRDAIGILDQLATYTDKTITNENVVDFLGLVDAGVIETGIDLLISGQTEGVFEYVESLVQTGLDLRQFVSSILSYSRDLFIVSQVKTEQRLHLLVSPDKEVIKRLQKQADQLGEDRIRSFTAELSSLFEEIKSSAQPRLAVELTLIRMMRGEELTIEAMAARIASLETQTNKPGSASSATIPAAGIEPPRSGPSESAQTKAADEAPRRAPAKDNAAGDVEVKSSEADLSGPETKAALKKVEETSSKSVGKKEGNGEVTLDIVKNMWPEILSEAKKKKLSLNAFLIEGNPSAVTDGSLIISFGSRAAFAGKELEKRQNAEILKAILSEVLGTKLDFSTIVDKIIKEPVVAKNEAPKLEEKQEEDLGKESALDMIKESFGAEVVDKKT